ncbi:MAG: rRNA pseudouridine synthase [Firmicutes bacterium]|nr:rRNA pseudouridine synthase [Bacillota bacterium]
MSKNNIIKHTDEKDEVRINKYLSDKGLCSRREADRLIAQGRVRINGKAAEMGSRVGSGDTVFLDNKQVSAAPESRVYMAFNKPVGITCTTDRTIRGNIVDYINYPQRIFHVGRLDKDSEGLILMTNDGDIVNKILRASNNHEKEYIVTVDNPVTGDFLKNMSSGVPILDTVTKPCTVDRISKHVFRIILTQGLNRQIRRMCAFLGYKVVKLKRIRIMNINLGDLPSGKWRYLTESELSTLNSLISTSSKTHDASN